MHKKKKQVKDKGFLMSKYPHDPIIRGPFFKINKKYAKLRKYKKKQFRQQIIDKLDTFQSNNPKEYWNLVNFLRESKRDNPEKSIDDEIWLTYFSELSRVPPKFDKNIEELNKKAKELEQTPELNHFPVSIFAYQPLNLIRLFAI